MASIVSKTIKFRDSDFILSYPTVGQIIDIEVTQQHLSKGTLKELLMGLDNSVETYLYILAYSYVSVLLPGILRDARVSSLLELSIEDFQEIVDLYVDQIKPWLDENNREIKERILNKKK